MQMVLTRVQETEDYWYGEDARGYWVQLPKYQWLREYIDTNGVGVFNLKANARGVLYMTENKHVE